MKFEVLLEELLTEATPIEIYSKYYSKIPKATFIKIVSADPQSVVKVGVDTNIENRVQRIGKYSKLLLSLYIKNNLKLEDLDIAKEYLGYLYKHNLSVDINKVNDISDLYNLIEKYLVQDKRDISTILQSLSKEEYKILHNGENWLILQPLSEKSSCYLGVNASWCTTWGPYSLNQKDKDKTNRFNFYSKLGPLYIMINKSNEKEKYQFHFEKDEFKNIGNQDVKNISEFLNNNQEIKKFFFPSLFTEVSDKKQIESQLSKMFILSNEDSMELIRKTLSNDVDLNSLVKDILNNNEEGVNEKIVDNNLSNVIYFNKGYIVFPIDNIKKYRNIQSVSDRISWFRGDRERAYDRVYNDIADRFYSDEDSIYYLEPLFEKYYKENEVKVKTELGAINYEQFKRDYFEMFYKDDTIKQKFIEESTSLSVDEYENILDGHINDIEKYIKIEGGGYYRGFEVEVGVINFLQYILKNNISTINGNLFELIDDFIDDNDLPTDGDDYPEDLYSYGEYAGWDKMEFEIEKFFEGLIDDGEVTKECLVIRQKYNDVFNRIFKGKNYFENEHVIIKILMGVDCSNQSVKIDFKNKDTGKTYVGDVKVENLASYATNYQLFESFAKFKKNII
jgi:hypothetical protein